MYVALQESYFTIYILQSLVDYNLNGKVISSSQMFLFLTPIFLCYVFSRSYFPKFDWTFLLAYNEECSVQPRTFLPLHSGSDTCNHFWLGVLTSKKEILTWKRLKAFSAPSRFLFPFFAFHQKFRACNPWIVQRRNTPRTPRPRMI